MLIIPGININCSTQEFIEQMSAKIKTVETRNTPSLRAYVGRVVGIVETGKGAARLKGWAIIEKEIIYNSEKEFYNDYDRHRVDKNSVYRFNKIKYGYKIKWLMDADAIVTSKGIIARELKGCMICA